MMFYPPTAEVIRGVMESKGYVVFDSAKGYDLNLFGIRTADAGANTFNDWVGVMYLTRGVWSCFVFPATTDPGLYWRENPMNVSGTAILKPGQYRGAWEIGRHQGRYEALTQKKTVTVYRDADRDGELTMDEGNTQTGMFGINIHRASASALSSSVNKWSAGCQVLQDALHFDFLMALANKSKILFGNGFTYTLLLEDDFS